MIDLSKCIFVKFVKEQKHACDLRNGRLYMQSAHYYRTLEIEQLEESGVRSDSFENSSYIYSKYKDGEMENLIPFRFGNTTINKIHIGEDVKLLEPLKLVNVEKEKYIKIFSLYCIDLEDVSSGTLSSYIDKRMSCFGDYCCIIVNLDEFFQRVYTSLNKNHNDINRFFPCFPLYEDIWKHSGYWGPTRKPDSFFWQREFRLVFDTRKENDPFIYDLCLNLKDISFIGTTNALINGKIHDSSITLGYDF